MSKAVNRRYFLRRKHLRRIFVPFLVVITLPIIVSSVFFSARVKEEFKQSILEEVDHELVQIIKELDYELITLKNFSNNLIQRGVLKYALDVDEPVDYTPLMTELNRFKESQEFLEQVLVYFPNADYIVMNSTTSTKVRFFSQYNMANDSDFADLLELAYRDFYIRPSPIRIISPLTSDVAPYQLMIGHPVADFQGAPKATFVYTLKSLQRLFQSFEQKSHESSVFLKNVDGSELFSESFGARNEEERELQSFDQLLDNEHYLHRMIESDLSGWVLHAFIGSNSGFFAQLTDLNRIYLLIVASTILIALALLLITYKYGYEPVLRLNDKVSTIDPNTFGNDEISNIALAIDRLQERNKNLLTTLDKSSLSVRNHLVYRLITGQYESVKDFNNEGSPFGLRFHGSRFFVFILNFESTDSQATEQIATEVQELLMPEIDSYYLLDLRSKQIIFVGNTDENDDYVKAKLRYLGEDIGDIALGNLMIASSLPVPHFNDLVQAFLEASMVMDYRFVYSTGSVLFLDEVQKQEDTKFDFPYAIFDFFRNALLHKNSEQMGQAVSGIIGILEIPGLSLHITKSICAETERLIKEYSTSSSHNKDEANTNCDKILGGYETKSEFIAQLNRWYRMKHEELDITLNRGFTFVDVLQYLELNALSTDFSIYDIADHFGMSTSAFSKYFKEHSGHNFSDQMTAYRMTKAKELLQNSRIEIQEIAAKVGYYNVSSFNRRFKQVVGVTPTQFRQNYIK